jgi:hypothetical protein
MNVKAIAYAGISCQDLSQDVSAEDIKSPPPPFIYLPANEKIVQPLADSFRTEAA